MPLSQARLEEVRVAAEANRVAREEALQALNAELAEALRRGALAEAALEALKERLVG